jgi:hypothetical protein
MIIGPADTISFLTKEAEFAWSFYQAAELEVRATERYVLIGLAAMYSYLASTKSIPRQFQKIAWHAPTFVVIFAGIRALGLGWRQYQLMRYLQALESRVLCGDVKVVCGEVKILCADANVGWAFSFIGQKSMVALSAGLFYVLLAIFTVFVAYQMTKRNEP